MEEIILQTKDLTKKYQNKVVVDNLNIQIKRGEIFGLLGPNGAGKSTTMNMISSIVRPTAGSIELFGKDPMKQKKDVFHKIGYIPQELAIHGNLKAWENVELFTSLYSHSGWMEGEAKFVADKCAVAKYEDSVDDDEEYIVFIFENQEMKVLATASSENLGFGMNVSMDGEYTQDEPLYTNANILNETFSEEELSVFQSNMPEEYYNDFFLFSTTNGVVTNTKSDNGDRTIEAFVPTMTGYGYTLTIVNEKDCTITFEDETSFQFSF